MAEPEECGRLGAFDVRLRMLHRPFAPLITELSGERARNADSLGPKVEITSGNKTPLHYLSRRSNESGCRRHHSESTDALNSIA